MGSEALQLALALYRVPIRRHALRSMELPDDIGVVIQLASASQPQLQDAAAELGETENTILEAARFYLQQALFQADASAYRVLGLSVNASADRIREHYRWLQRWLHPDRRGEDWESLLATRVNWAWGHLRNDALRSAYDLAHHPVSAEPRANESGTKQATSSKSFDELGFLHVAQEANSWPKRIAIALTLASGLVFLYVAGIRDDAALPEDIGTGSTEQMVPSPWPGPSDRSTPSKTRVEGTTASQSKQALGSDSPVRQSTPDQSLRPETPVANVPPNAEIVSVSQSQTAKAGMQAHAVVSTVAIAPTTVPQTTRSGLTQSATSAGTNRLAQHRSPVMTTPDVAAGPESNFKSSRQRPQSTAVVPERSAFAPDRAAEATDSATPPVISPGMRQVAAMANSSGQGAAISFPIADSRASAEPTDSLARMGLARTRLRELSGFFVRLDARPPPVWNDAAGEISAEQQRSAMYKRTHSRSSDDFVVDTPIWRLSEGAASLSAGYHLLGGRSIFESGQLKLSMIWRENMWLVTNVELDPTQ